VLGVNDFRGGALVLGVALCALLALAGVEADGPLLLNLGAGDEPYARGFRPGWERDGRTGSGETMFHWTEDGARLEFPVEVVSGAPVLRMRLARFSDTPAVMTLVQAGRVVERWTQAPRGWTVRSFALGAVRGPLAVQLRSESPDGLGVALDWVEVQGVRGLVPRRDSLLRIAVLLLGLPLLVGLVQGARLGALVLGLLCLGLALASRIDRLGALEALARGAPAALCAAATLALLVLLLQRAWPDAPVRRAARVALPGAAAATLLLSHPFFYYPDVTTHARFLAALRENPYLAWDASEYQDRTGTWAVREVAGQRVKLPYSPAFHLLAWPYAPRLGEAAALKVVAGVALGASLVLVHVLAAAAGQAPAAAVAAQALYLLWPVTASRLCLALFPTLLGQAADLLLVVHLARRFPDMTGARAAAFAFLFLVAAQLAYTGSVFNVALVIGLFGAAELVAGAGSAARRLLGAYAAAAAAVFLLQYVRYLPTIARLVTSHADPAQAGAGLLGPALDRFALFYDGVAPLLALVGVWALASAPRHVRRLLLASVGAGVILLLARFAAPGVFRDAKEIELMAPSLAVLSVAGVAFSWARGRAGRALGALCGLSLLAWGAASAAAIYAARFVAIGRT
jgi:hypothetical protein